MRYTSQAAMDQQGLRDVDRWKDKIEVRLDNRQVAFLFFGSALVACMLFILGVIVGKRLESRGRALAPEIEDPLALLDRVAATAPPAEAPVVESAPAPPKPAKPIKRELPPVEQKVAPPRPSEQPTAAPTASAPAAAAETKPAAKPAAETKPVEAPPAKSADILPPSFEPPPSTAETKPAASKETSATKKPRFMLQVGAFADRAEAEAYAGTLSAERPTVIMSEIPGKGIWYRVRLGGFQTFKEAVDAKSVFERRHNKIALVVGPL